eukprot:613681_1
MSQTHASMTFHSKLMQITNQQLTRMYPHQPVSPSNTVSSSNPYSIHSHNKHPLTHVPTSSMSYNNTTNPHHDMRYSNEKRSPNHKPFEGSTPYRTLPQILQTSDIINWPLPQHLLELKRIYNRDHSKWYKQIDRSSTGIKGLYKIGNYMWLENIEEPTQYHKVKARSFAQFIQWIPQQHKQYLEAWKCYSASSLTSGQELAQMLSDAQQQNHVNRALVLNVFRKRLLMFVDVIKTVYTNTVPNTHHTDDTKNRCTRCGKTSHSSHECWSKKHVNGTPLTPPSKKQNKWCKFGINCNNSRCTFKHTHLCPHGKYCQYGGKCNLKQSLFCTRCNRKNHVVEDCTARYHLNGRHLSSSPTKQNKNTKNKWCRLGMRCHNSDCNLKHKHKRDTNALYCTRCKRTNHIIGDCHATHSVDSKPLGSCSGCGRNNHNYSHCREREPDQSNGNDSSNLPPTRKRTYEHVHMSGAYTEEIPLKKRKTNDIYRNNAGVNDIKSMDSKAERVVMRCAYCNVDLTHKDLWRCSQCKHKFYCGKECQSLHWQVHKLECGKPAASTTAKHDIKMERVPVQDWSCYSIIYWFNRARDGQFRDIKYMELRKHFVIGKVKGGCDLMSINAVMLRMMGIHDRDEQDMVLNAIFDVVTNDDFDNVFANTSNTDEIPKGLMDPVLYELLRDPVRVQRFGYIYERSFITKYIAANKMDPLTRESVKMSDIVQCKELEKEIMTWRNRNMINGNGYDSTSIPMDQTNQSHLDATNGAVPKRARIFIEDALVELKLSKSKRESREERVCAYWAFSPFTTCKKPECAFNHICPLCNHNTHRINGCPLLIQNKKLMKRLVVDFEDFNY